MDFGFCTRMAKYQVIVLRYRLQEPFTTYDAEVQKYILSLKCGEHCGGFHEIDQTWYTRAISKNASLLRLGFNCLKKLLQKWLTWYLVRTESWAWECSVLYFCIERPKCPFYFHSNVAILLTEFGGDFCMMWMLHHTQQIMVD